MLKIQKLAFVFRDFGFRNLILCYKTHENGAEGLTEFEKRCMIIL